MRETQVQPLGQKDPLEERAWQPTPVCLPGKSHVQRSLVGYSPWDLKELDMTERLNNNNKKGKKKAKALHPKTRIENKVRFSAGKSSTRGFGKGIMLKASFELPENGRLKSVVSQ